MEYGILSLTYLSNISINLMQINKAKKGFTLIELLIVIAIIGLLATLAIVSLTTAQRKARDTKRIADVKQLQNAVELYYSENTTYPVIVAADTWSTLGTAITSYITNVPIDPDNTAPSVYTYGVNDAGTEYFIGAVLEDIAHDALNGDDDTAYVVTVAGAWDNLAPVESDGSAAASGGYDCDDTGGEGVYCASE